MRTSPAATAITPGWRRSSMPCCSIPTMAWRCSTGSSCRSRRGGRRACATGAPRALPPRSISSPWCAAMGEAMATDAGFADPAVDAAQVFRTLLEAMARPGRIQPLPIAVAAPPMLGSHAAQLCLTLCDLDTPLWIDPAYASEASVAYLRFHAGCPVVSAIEDAAFLLVAPAHVAQVLQRCRVGTAEYPDRSATL